jgi:diacylglycerol kinase (ATP)
MKTGKHGIIRILYAFKYSFDGFAVAFRTEEAFKQDVLVFIIMSLLAFFLNITIIEKILLFGSLFLIIIAELVNTALEVIVNRISGRRHIYSKIAKDIGSCVVLCSFLYFLLVWSLILYTNYQEKGFNIILF